MVPKEKRKAILKIVHAHKIQSTIDPKKAVTHSKLGSQGAASFIYQVLGDQASVIYNQWGQIQVEKSNKLKDALFILTNFRVYILRKPKIGRKAVKFFKIFLFMLFQT